MNTLKKTENRLDFKEQHMSFQQCTVRHFYTFLLFCHEGLKPWPTGIMCLPLKQPCSVNSNKHFRKDLNCALKINSKSCLVPVACYTEAMVHRELFARELTLYHHFQWNLKVRKAPLLWKRGLLRLTTKVSLSGKSYLLTKMAGGKFALTLGKGLGLVSKDKRCWEATVF